ncbi:transporter mfs1 [Achaetomium macrosporum]|uniref:Transporter mfs1 n=1 Tax=Achaetomium macrosporum TaxID=79813 RepID=A0AAN7H5U9_9PEZI|nr:transporter mfs1 [Achaetomium macrosporum]
MARAEKIRKLLDVTGYLELASPAAMRATSLIISSFAFLSPLCSSIIVPALTSIIQDLHIPHGVQLQLVLSIFLLVYALGPFVLSPCSEVWGRTPMIRIGNLLFIFFTGLCGFAASQGQITAFRFLARIRGSASIGMVLAMIGQAQLTTWRWCFWVVVIVNVAMQIIAAFCLRETYPLWMLQLKARVFRNKVGDLRLKTEWEQSEADHTLAELLRVALSRPWIMLTIQPIIIIILALYQSFNYGTLYLLISEFPALYEDRYGMLRGDASLNYLSLAIGSLIGSNICGPATDYVYTLMKRREGKPVDKPGRPKMRMPLMVPAFIITFLVLLGISIFAGSSMICYQCMSAYIADLYMLHSASASAACAFLRSACGFLFPLFVPALFENLGYGWGGRVVAGLAVVVGIPCPWIIMIFVVRLEGESVYHDREERRTRVWTDQGGDSEGLT